MPQPTQPINRSYAKSIFFTALYLLLITGVTGCQSQAQEGPAEVTKAENRPIANLRDLSKAFVDIAAEIKPAVVTVSTQRVVSARMNPFGDNPLFDFFFDHPGGRQSPEQREFRQRGLGSGVIVSEDGHILTNYHVIAEADSIFIRMPDGQRYEANIIGSDPKTDIAVLDVEAENLQFLEAGNSDELDVGEIVLAVGSPMSENLALTVTQGIVSAKGRSNVGLADYEDFIQTDAAINPGNSGGPLVNLDGQLVGINTAIASRSGGFQGIGFAVPVNMAIRIMNSLLTEGRVVRGWLGVTIQEINEALANAMGLDQTGGALIGNVMEDTPADEAGLQAGDVITAINGVTVDNTADLRNRIASTKPGSTVELDIIRDDEEMTIVVELGEMPETMAQAGPDEGVEQLLGFTTATLTPDIAAQLGVSSEPDGVYVASIDPTSEAYQNGLRQGDVISSVNKRAIHNQREFLSAISGLDKGDTILLRAHREDTGFYVAFTL